MIERIAEALDKYRHSKLNYDWHKDDGYTGKPWYGLVEFWTYTAGQDIPTEFDFDGTAEDFVKQFCEAAEHDLTDQEWITRKVKVKLPVVKMTEDGETPQVEIEVA